MRNTSYADELVEPAILQLGENDEARIELLHIHGTDDDEYRISWWKDGRLMPRALDLNEDHLIALFERGIITRVFRPTFIKRLRRLLQTGNESNAA